MNFIKNLYNKFRNVKQKFIMWWIIVNIQTTIISVAYYFGFFDSLYTNDITHLGFVLVGLYFVTTAWIGRITAKKTSKGIDVGWFISEMCLMIGMIGTVIGFIAMLSIFLTGLDMTNTASLIQAISGMGAGMGTALYTTLVG